MNIKRIIYIILFIILFIPCMVNAESKYLYDVLKDEAESNGLAREYTGEHHDSFTEEPSKKIFHWYADNDTDGNAVTEKNNVIFANHCWQMIRTTDTGGVKLIYNGLANEGKCLDDRTNHVGYKSSETQNMSGSYWYSDDYEFNSESNTFELKGEKRELSWSEDNKEEIIGKYTCKSSENDAKCSNLYLVLNYKDNQRAYVISLSSDAKYSQVGKLAYNGEANSEAYLGYKYGNVYPNKSKDISRYSFTILTGGNISTSDWYGTSVTKINNSNLYTMNNKFQIQGPDDYYKLVGRYTFFNTDKNYQGIPFYIVDVNYNNRSMYYYKLASTTDPNVSEPNSYIYGDSYTDNGNGTYTINNATTIYRKNYYTNYENLNKKYLCIKGISTAESCTSVYYVYNTTATRIDAQKLGNIYKFSSNYTYENGMYKLQDNIVELQETTSPNSIDLINQNRYTCLNNSTECEELSYVTSIKDSSIYYI